MRGRAVTTVTFLNEDTVTALSHAVVTGTHTRLNAIAGGARDIGRYCHGLRPKGDPEGLKVARRAIANLGDTTSAFRMTDIPEADGVTYDVVFIRYRSAVTVVQRVSNQTEEEWSLTLSTAKKAAVKLKAVYAKRR
ncbi:hypothetical protein Acor_24680 [Acrocarpospora corrugata]|uniref:Uncharacterized protein n=1 Tax=Acrocarpospora corrugata TaxID=35763 RepID=A0A5M3VV73_9ACTN|nr:hypothetical protein [Acrocarpospora corrugata]GES00404.1 hypothetical protein Acor_24680 [Acrocarpospora corrugata]